MQWIESRDIPGETLYDMLKPFKNRIITEVTPPDRYSRTSRVMVTEVVKEEYQFNGITVIDVGMGGYRLEKKQCCAPSEFGLTFNSHTYKYDMVLVHGKRLLSILIHSTSSTEIWTCMLFFCDNVDVALIKSMYSVLDEKRTQELYWRLRLERDRIK